MNKDDAVITEQGFGKKQVGIHHAEPVAVKVADVFAVLAENAPFHEETFSVIITDALQVIFLFLAESIGANKTVASCVVWRVNNDALYLAVICLLQDFEDFKIFAFNKEVCGYVKVYGFFRDGF
ncbi:MAG: hypothetical protein HZB80_01425 [Deltaproteobacteria bacterium]|nr:hypothetical protein [Deltaproteobacteria bacterium]